jgi:hypothetical protein
MGGGGGGYTTSRKTGEVVAPRERVGVKKTPQTKP